MWPLAANAGVKKIGGDLEQQRTYGHAKGSLEMMRVTRRRHSVINCVALHGGEFHSTI